jgi:hypothetical protein
MQVPVCKALRGARINYTTSARIVAFIGLLESPVTHGGPMAKRYYFSGNGISSHYLPSAARITAAIEMDQRAHLNQTVRFG